MRSGTKFISLLLAVIILTGTMAVQSFAAEQQFKDVSAERWSYEYIKYAVDNGYMNGVGDGRFNPAGSTTRAMVATVLWRRQGEPVPSSDSGFSDVKSGQWYSDAIAWAKESGVVNGISETRFAPMGEITREQLATMLYRYADFNDIYVGEKARDDLSAFDDAGKVSDWALEAVKWAVYAGLIAGVTDSTIVPKGLATREQFAAILQRFDSYCKITYADPVVVSNYTEKPYELVEDADIYVSTDGDDTAAGTKDDPIKTFARATEMVRTLKSEKESSVVVAFMAGEYGDPAIKLTSEDSGTKEAPVIYCAYGDGDVIFSGGAVFYESDFSELTSEEKTLFPDKAVSLIKKADMSEKYPDYSVTDVLFSDAGVMTVARFPNKYAGGTDQLMKGGYTPDDNHIQINVPLFTRRIAKYHTLEGLYFYGYLTTGWYKDLLLTDGYTINEENGGYDFLIPHPETARMGYLRHEPEFASDFYNNMAFVNMSEELDNAGEFWVDTNTDTLYIYDPSGDYSFTTSDICIDMDHTDYITFRGLTFTSYKTSMIEGDRCHGLTVDRCTITKCAGDNAIHLDGCDKGRDFDIMIKDSEFSVFACRPIEIVGDNYGSYIFDRHGNVDIYNNYFSYTNLTKDDGGAVHIMRVDDAHVYHNDFDMIYRCAVDYGGCKNLVVEYNSFKNCMYNSSDGGICYCWNNFEDWNNIIRYNVFFKTSWYGVYIDDDEPGTNVYSNIFFDQAAVVVHDGRNNKINNNVIIRGGVSITPGNRETVEQAIANNDLESLTSVGYYQQWKRLFDSLEQYPEMKAGFQEHFPEVFDLSIDLNDVNEKSFVLNPANEITGNYFIVKNTDEYSEDHITSSVSMPWCTIENNKFIEMEENPIFVNPGAGDYRIREDADFPDIYFELAGRE